MTFSLALIEGDLRIGNGGLATVTGSQKLLQDLRCWVLQKMGSNRNVPGYGSLIEGGVEPNGRIVRSPIGTTHWDIAEGNISSEIQRIISAYQAQQIERVQEDNRVYNKTTISSEELLKKLIGITFTSNLDTLTVVVSIENGVGRNLEVEIPLQATILS